MDESKLESIRDLTKFAPKFLIIRSKSGEPQPFTFNRAQLYIHSRLETQRQETGRVRAIILKGRQAGTSTLIQARYFHRVISSRGKKAFILTHEAEATKNLFEMTKRYYDNLSDGLCPKADTSSAKELHFTQFDSGYSVGTAGNKGVGRSQTIQLFHGCLAEGTKIFNPLTGGIKNIESFIVGDVIQTHTGEPALISYISTQVKECFAIKLRTLTVFPLIATPEHRFWTKDGWKRLDNFKHDDVIGYPVKKIFNRAREFLLRMPEPRAHGGGRQFVCPDRILIDYNFGRIVGLYLAEGHIKLQHKEPHQPSCVSFSVHRKELGRTIEWLAPFHEYYSSMKTEDKEDCLTSVVTVYGNRFATLINEICGRVKGKHIPLNWDLMGEEFCQGLLHGYISGDGSSYSTDRRVRATSICSAITITLRDIAASLGYGWASIEFKVAGIRHGRNEKDRYTFSLCGDGASILAREIGKDSPLIVRKKTESTERYAANTTEISDGYAWLRINSIQYDGKHTVYDFEIDHEDHSYCTIHGGTHNSEVGFWPHADEHAKGVMQAVSDEPGTEIILESTANGIGNYFHARWVAAMAGESGYQAIFVPWYWQPEYRINTPGLVLTDEEEGLMAFYKDNGLTPEHLAWRRIKIAGLSTDFDAGLEQFKQEYPFSANEAFLNPIANVFINAKHVMRARKADVTSNSSLIIGVDVAVGDRDRTAIIRRKGRSAYNLEKLANHNTMEICGYLKRLITQEQPAKVYVDCIGIGAGVVDRMQEMGYHCVEGVNVARSANDKERFRNLRAELWSDMRDWLAQEMPVQIPDDDELHGELCSLGFKYTSNGQLQIESKDDLRARGMPSPDGADALALTYYGGFYDAEPRIEVITRKPHEKGMFS